MDDNDDWPIDKKAVILFPVTTMNLEETYNVVTSF